MKSIRLYLYLEICSFALIVLTLTGASDGCARDRVKQEAGKPVIRLITPRGGEVWREGGTCTVTWESSGVERLLISAAVGGKDKGFLSSLEEGIPAGPGAFKWRIPRGFVTGTGVESSNRVRVMLCPAEGNAECAVSGTFTVTEGICGSESEGFIGEDSPADTIRAYYRPFYPNNLLETGEQGTDMEGWTEEEIKGRSLMAPCGLYCGTCGVYIATRDGNSKFKTVLGKLYGTKPEETECVGCMQPDPPKKLYSFCATCAIRDCVRSKGYYSCHQCDQWPCDKIENFGLATGVRVMKRTIPVWREKVAEYGDDRGSEKWARHECERYHCPSCGKPLFRGAQRCRFCKTPVADELDGSL